MAMHGVKLRLGLAYCLDILGDSDVIALYHVYTSCFPQALTNVCYYDITFR